MCAWFEILWRFSVARLIRPNRRICGASNYISPRGVHLRRFLLHVLPGGFHRIRHYGFLASGRRAANIDRIRELIGEPEAGAAADTPNPSFDKGATENTLSTEAPCPCCGGRMRNIETFTRGQTPRTWPTNRIWIDSSWPGRPDHYPILRHRQSAIAPAPPDLRAPP